MGSAGRRYESLILDAILGDNRAPNMPGTVHLALCTTAPTDDALGTEPAGGGYGRLAVVNNSANWPNAANGRKSNGAVLTFPTPTVSWGLVGWFMVMDIAAGGNADNLIAYGRLAVATTITVGQAPRWPVGTLVITHE